MFFYLVVNSYIFCWFLVIFLSFSGHIYRSFRSLTSYLYYIQNQFEPTITYLPRNLSKSCIIANYTILNKDMLEMHVGLLHKYVTNITWDFQAAQVLFVTRCFKEYSENITPSKCKELKIISKFQNKELREKNPFQTHCTVGKSYTHCTVGLLFGICGFSFKTFWNFYKFMRHPSFSDNETFCRYFTKSFI